MAVLLWHAVSGPDFLDGRYAKRDEFIVQDDTCVLS